MEPNIDRLYSQDTANYLDRADRRIVSGFRFAVELLELPMPTAAVTRPSGPRRTADLLGAYHTDNPTEAIKDRQHNLEAGFAASKANRQARIK